MAKRARSVKEWPGKRSSKRLLLPAAYLLNLRDEMHDPWTSNVSTPPNPTTKAPAEERSGNPFRKGIETKRGNRAQLIVGGAVALVLIGTTAFVLLREPSSTPPESAPAAQPAPPPAAAPPASVAVAPPAPPKPAPVIPPPAATPEPAPPSAPPSVAAPSVEPQAPLEKPVAKSAKTKQATAPAGNGRFYTLQLDSFLVPANAKALVARLNAHGGSAYEQVRTDADGKKIDGGIDVKSGVKAGDRLGNDDVEVAD